MKVKDIFKNKGVLSKEFNNYESREGQIKMSELVEKAIKNKVPAVIEGSTGVGKSLAYLVPTILSGKKTIISTSNKSLQDQLDKKDLPLLKKALGEEVSFNWEVLKGKNNYFCSEHFKANEEVLLDTLNRLEVQRIVDWSQETEDGDVEYYPGELERNIRDMITCDSYTQHEKNSPFYASCFANQARDRAKESQILLVNHTLLALHLALLKKTDGKVSFLPRAEVIVIDEAHSFEEYAAKAFSDEINIFSLRHFTGWRVVKESVPKHRIYMVQELLSDILKEYQPEKGDSGYYIQERIAKVENTENLIVGILQIVESVKSNTKWNKDEISRAKVREVAREGKNLTDRIERMSIEDKNTLRWAEARDSRYGVIVTLKSVPLDISELLKDQLFSNFTVISTSATLAVNGGFDFFKLQLGVPDNALELVVESPFDFKKNALVFISDGSNTELQDLEELLKLSRGNAFVLFTSYKAMEFHYSVKCDYPKFIQRAGVSRAKLLEDFKNTPNAVLFATKSFWEGVDIPGDNLLQVIIHKIPFGNPYELLYKSKTERVDEMAGYKGAHWNKFTIPSACLQLKQGVGRLIRTKDDIGVISLLDSRVNHKSYKNSVINSFPPAHRTQKLENVKMFFDTKKYS